MRRCTVLSTLLLWPMLVMGQNAQPTRPASEERVRPPSDDATLPVRNEASRPRDEVVTLRHYRIKKGSFAQFLDLSVNGVWPYFEKVGARIVGMWQVINPDAPGSTSPNQDYDEVWLMTRYASLDHWRATRDPWRLGGNGPDWQACKRAMDSRAALTISSELKVLKGYLSNAAPFFMPSTSEVFERKH